MVARGGLHFGEFCLDPVTHRFWRESEQTFLRPKVFAVLQYLAENPQRLVTQEELLAAVWNKVAVSEGLLRGYVRDLRQILGDDVDAPRYIETVPGRGYRFIAEVEIVHQEGAASPATRRPAVPAPPIRVGVLHSLTGMMAWTESPVVDATLLAIEEINHRGGIRGRPIEARVVDGQSDEDVFAHEAEGLIKEHGAVTLFGCWTSASRKTVRSVVERNDHLLVYPVQFEGLEQSANIFYLGAVPNQQIVPAVLWSFEAMKATRFFLIGWDSIYSRAVNAILRDEITAAGGEITGEEYLSPESTEIALVIQKIVRDKPDLIFNSTVGDINVLYSRALRAAGVTPEVVPTIYFSIGEIELRSLSPREATGDYAAWSYFQSLDAPANHSFVSRFRARYGAQRVIGDPMQAAYAGVHLWAQAAEQSGADDIGLIRRALREQTFDAPGGLMRIDPETQHAWKTFRLGRVTSNGQFDVLWTSRQAIQPECYPASRSPLEWNEFLASLQARWEGRWTCP